MEYISAEEFLKQPEKVRKVFIDWWKPEIGDLVYPDYDSSRNNFLNLVTNYDDGLFQVRIGTHLWYETSRALMLLTEGQLRQFIEDKTGGGLDIETRTKSIDITIWSNTIPGGMIVYDYLSEKLIEAYWQVACKIASMEVSNE